MASTDFPDGGALQPEEIQDVDSALGSDESTYTETLRSSLLQSVRENGRLYHKYRDGTYILPEDEQEQNRLDMQHEIFMRTFNNKLVLAPIPDKIENVRKSNCYATPVLGITLVNPSFQSRPWYRHRSLGHSICRRASRNICHWHRLECYTAVDCATKLQVRSRRFRADVDLAEEI